MAKGCYDFLTYYLEEYYRKEQSNIIENSDRLKLEMFAPLVHFKNKNVPKSKSDTLLHACLDRAYKKLQVICAGHSVDFWLSVIRRFPNSVLGNEDWIRYATLAVVKWAEWEKDTTWGSVTGDNQFGLIYPVEDKDILECWYIAILANIIHGIIVKKRWISKGAALRVNSLGLPELDIPEIVDKSVKFYERRRPKKFFLHEEGVMVNSDYLNGEYLMFPHHLRYPMTMNLIKNNMKLHLMNYIFLPMNTSSLSAMLNHYEEALLEQFSIGNQDIINVIYSLSKHMETSFPEMEFKDGFIDCLSDNDEKNGKHTIKFYFDACQKGYLRMPLEHLKERLCEENYFLYPRTKEEASAIIDAFFNAFMISSDKRDKIALTDPEYCALIYTSPSGMCYIDLIMLGDFLRMLVSKSKEWYSTQHGDRFTLTLKRYVLDNCSAVRFEAFKRKFYNSKGEQAEVDLLFSYQNRLYIIECKAYTKSTDYINGDYRSIYTRTAEIKQAAEQAVRAKGILESYISQHPDEFPNCEGVDWIVCSPTQEYLMPINKFGMLTSEIPKVCIPEELVSYFR